MKDLILDLLIEGKAEQAQTLSRVMATYWRGAMHEHEFTRSYESHWWHGFACAATMCTIGQSRRRYRRTLARVRRFERKAAP